MQNSKINFYHFYPLTLILSVVFLCLNIIFFAFVFGQKKSFESLSPQIIFAKGQQVQLKTPFQNKSLVARSGQDLMIHSIVSTGDNSFAEIQLGKNTVRLTSNTDIELLENAVDDKNKPRLSFYIHRGTVWLNANDKIRIQSARASVDFNGNVGFYQYANSVNEVGSLFGPVVIDFQSVNSAKLATFVIPSKNQIQFANSQLTSDYGRLENSKLKKELKMQLISSAIQNDTWVKNKIIDESHQFEGAIESENQYQFKKRIIAIHSYFLLNSADKKQADLKRAELKLNYLMGRLHNLNENDQADIVLEEFNQLKAKLLTEPDFIEMIQVKLNQIQRVRSNSVAYKVKDNLRDTLFQINKDPQLLRTYLLDIDLLFQLKTLKQVEVTSKKWLANWKPALIASHPHEWALQARLYHHLAVSNAERMDLNLLSFLDRLEELSGKNLLETAQNRLEMSRALVVNEKYLEAKSYLRNSYSKLSLGASNEISAAQDLFVKEGALLSDRIAFAEQSLKGSADSIDETDFRNYLSNQERDKTLAERFNNLLEDQTQIQVEQVNAPTISEVIQQLSQQKIIAIPQDIEVNAKNPFIFSIKAARLIDRNQKGELMTFSAQFDESAKAFYELILNGKPLKGSYALEDLVGLLLVNGSENIPAIKESPVTTLDSLLGTTTDDDTLDRSQLLAQDLAVQLMIKELDSYEISIPSAQQVSILDQKSLQRFKIEGIFIESPQKDRLLEVDFDYNLDRKMITNIFFKEDLSIQIPSEIKADQLINVVFGGLANQQREAQIAQDLVAEWQLLGLSIDKNRLQFIDNNQNEIAFEGMTLREMPINFSGVYNRLTKILIKAEGNGLILQNVTIADYLPKLSAVWIIESLSAKGIDISTQNIASSLPSNKVLIQNYLRGEKLLSFVYDITNNRLLNVAVQGQGGVVSQMSFEEFKLIQ